MSLSSFDHIKDGFYDGSGMHGDDCPSMSSWLNETKKDDIRRFNMLDSLVVNRNVLDFGCGAGGFLKKVAAVANCAVGIELEDRARHHLNTLNNLTVFKKISDISSCEKFDIITAFHVLEHLPDPLETLKVLKNITLDDGYIVVEVPNSDDALLTLFDSDAFQKFTYWSQHLFLFNSANLKTLARKSGLEVVSVKHVQRYPLANHLQWLAKNKPGGHRDWAFLCSETLDKAYEAQLAGLGITDTIVAFLSPNKQG